MSKRTRQTSLFDTISASRKSSKSLEEASGPSSQSESRCGEDVTCNSYNTKEPGVVDTSVMESDPPDRSVLASLIFIKT